MAYSPSNKILWPPSPDKKISATVLCYNYYSLGNSEGETLTGGAFDVLFIYNYWEIKINYNLLTHLKL